MTVIPRPLISPVSPLNRRPTTPSLYLLTPPMSMPSNVAFTPNCSDSRAESATSAACSSALVGMHPTCRQVPPSLPFSTSATVSRAGRRAGRRRSRRCRRRGSPRRTVAGPAGVGHRPPLCLVHVGAGRSPRHARPGHPCTRPDTADTGCRSTAGAHWRGAMATLGPWVSDGPVPPTAARSVRRPRGRGRPRSARADSADAPHLAEFAATRRGSRGSSSRARPSRESTMLLVAHDGEWTRRRVPSVEWAHTFANKFGIPSYDAAVVGYRRGCGSTTGGRRSRAASRPGPPARWRAPPASQRRRRCRRLGTCAVRAALVEARTGDVEVRPAADPRRRTPAGTPRRRSRRRTVDVVLDQVGDVAGVRTLTGISSGDRQRPHRLAGPGSGVADPTDAARRRCPACRSTRSPSATTHAPVRVATSTSRSGFELGGHAPARRRGRAGPRRRC